jgi:hypothetical protein
LPMSGIRGQDWEEILDGFIDGHFAK